MGHRSETFAAERLSGFIERLERLDEERAALAGDLREVYSEAKGVGFDTKAMRQIVRLRKQEPAEREEQREILDIYLDALGMGDGNLYAPGVREAAALFNAGLSVRQVAEQLALSPSEAGKLRQRGEAAGLVTAPKGKAGRPRIVSEQKSAETISDRETVSGAESAETNCQTPPAETELAGKPKEIIVSEIENAETVAEEAAGCESAPTGPAAAAPNVSRGTNEEPDLDLPQFLKRGEAPT